MDEDAGAGSVGDLLARVERRVDLARRRGSWVVHPNEDDPYEIGLLLRLASSRFDARLADRLAGSHPDLSLLDVEVLRRLRVHPAGGAELAERLGRSPQRLSVVLGRLVDAGLVEREQSWRDLRVSTARLTDEGLDVLEAVELRLAPVVTWPLDGLGPDAARMTRLLLAALAAA